jgi:imidazole glycerol phosphate synthase subunit HisF
MKPSVYVKDILHCKEIKNYGFVYKYFSDIGLLLKTINTYHKSKKDEITLWNILKSNYDEKIIWK